jgi:transporter family-2 protein
MLTSAAINSSLTILGTIAVGLAGQMIFSLIADRWGTMGLPQRSPTSRDMVALKLILNGSVVLLFLGGA